MIALAKPTIEEDDLQAVRQALASGHLVQGRHVADFEASIARYVGVDHAVAVSNGTAALHISLLALDTQPGQQVVVTAYSFTATANVIELCGAEPVFVDVQPDTFNMDPNALETTLQRIMAKADSARRVRAIVPVHTFGQMADMRAILELADRYGLPVIEDAACALGATLHGKQAGVWGRMGCFSFHPRKAITTGEGGLVATHDLHLAGRLRALRNHGQDPDAPASDFIMTGFNYRMTEFQAALGLSQLAKLERILAVRRRLAQRYDELFRGTLLVPPFVASDGVPVYQSYVVLLPARLAPRRDDIIARLRDQGIETAIGTYNMPMTTYFRHKYGYNMGDFPVADDVFGRSLAIPLYESLTEEEQVLVARSLQQTVLELPESQDQG